MLDCFALYLQTSFTGLQTEALIVWTCWFGMWAHGHSAMWEWFNMYATSQFINWSLSFVHQLHQYQFKSNSHVAVQELHSKTNCVKAQLWMLNCVRSCGDKFDLWDLMQESFEKGSTFRLSCLYSKCMPSTYFIYLHILFLNKPSYVLLSELTTLRWREVITQAVVLTPSPGPSFSVDHWWSVSHFTCVADESQCSQPLEHWRTARPLPPAIWGKESMFVGRGLLMRALMAFWGAAVNSLTNAAFPNQEQ